MSEEFYTDSNYYMNKIEAIEELEDLGLCDTEMYLDKIKMLQLVAVRNHSKDDIKRVWGEYSMVSQITSQPELMNKAMSIPLTKDEVAKLIKDLNRTYSEKIKLLSNNPVGLIFSVTDRGHARSDTFTITLPKLGDWRFGYTKVFSAELVFHEFSHALDFGRTMGSNVHRHDFVRILDAMLLKYEDWILERYNPINQRNQIIENNYKLIDFYANKEQIIAEEKRLEESEIKDKVIKQAELYAEIGLTENTFPVDYLMKEDFDVKKSYLLFIMDSYKSNLRTPNDKKIGKDIVNKLKNGDFILNKDEINLLNTATKLVKRTSFLSTLPFSQQISFGDKLQDFEKQINDLSNGVVKGIVAEDKYKVRTYTEAELLKKYKLED